MTTPLHLVAINPGLSEPSSTRMLVDRLVAAARAEATVRDQSLEVTIIDLRDLAVDIGKSLAAGFATGAAAQAVRQVESADAVIAATPVFNASYAGLFKSFIDLVSIDEVAGTPVLISATGGSPRHSMVLDHALRPLFSFLRMPVVSTGVYAASEDWAGTVDGVAPLADRIARAARELISMLPLGEAAARRDVDVVAEPDVQKDPVESAGIANFARLLGN